MLKAAQLYSEELKRKSWEIAYDDKYMYYNSGYSDEHIHRDTNWHMIDFASIDSNGDVIGHIKYEVDRWSNKAYNLCAVNFSDNKMVFGKDLYKVVQDIFMKYKFRKLTFAVFTDNPVTASYDAIVKKWGGEIVGIKKEDTKLTDGMYHDLKMYEISRDDYLNVVWANKRRKEGVLNEN